MDRPARRRWSWLAAGDRRRCRRGRRAGQRWSRRAADRAGDRLVARRSGSSSRCSFAPRRGLLGALSRAWQDARGGSAARTCSRRSTGSASAAADWTRAELGGRLAAIRHVPARRRARHAAPAGARRLGATPTRGWRLTPRRARPGAPRGAQAPALGGLPDRAAGARGRPRAPRRRAHRAHPDAANSRPSSNSRSASGARSAPAADPVRHAGSAP